MNWNQIQMEWKQLKTSAKQQFSRLTDTDLDAIAGKRETLAGKLQERYGYSREDAQHRADEWAKMAHQEAEHAHAGGSAGPSSGSEYKQKR